MRDVKQKAQLIRTLQVVFAVLIVLLTLWLLYLRFTQGRAWPKWTGFDAVTTPTGDYYPAKTLWDLLELLVIPATLALGVGWFSRAQEKTSKEIALDRRQQATLEAYYDRMADLLLKENLGTLTE
jgi:hypothetical protein